MFGRRYPRITREQECDRILERYGDNFEGIVETLDRQFATLHNRAQVLLAICGVLISASVLVTTGRIIGHPTFLHQHFAGRLLVIAGALEIAGAGAVVGGVLNVRWMTQQPGGDLRSWLLSNLAYRDAKVRSYRIAMFLVLVSMTTYQSAVAIALIQL